MPKGTFKYVFIPADDSKQIETLTGDKSGGLAEDFLQNEAKRYFYEKSDKAAQQAALDGANSEQRKHLANTIREQFKNESKESSSHTKMLTDLGDEALLDIMRTTHTSATCEITAITFPTENNNFRGVSMYTADDARNQNLPHNSRATNLLSMCGHNVNLSSSIQSSIGQVAPGGIFGDAFVGRYHDDESADIWIREDFTAEDMCMDPLPAWIETAKSGSALEESKEGNGDGYTWIQNDDEIEMRFPVTEETRTKHVKVEFRMKTLKIILFKEILIDVVLEGDVDPDNSTFTLEDDSKGGKELCVTLGKKERCKWRKIFK